MRRRRYQTNSTLSHEFELDLAPLLAVMVKLVPVLLVSSAFIQMMMVETELPQVVKQAIAQNEQKPTGSLQLDISDKQGLKLIFAQDGRTPEVVMIQNRPDGAFDLQTLHQRLVDVKSHHPEMFRLELNPGNNISYRDIVKIMDEARKSNDQHIRFPVQGGTETDYMFPNIVFVNVMEG